MAQSQCGHTFLADPRRHWLSLTASSVVETIREGEQQGVRDKQIPFTQSHYAVLASVDLGNWLAEAIHLEIQPFDQRGSNRTSDAIYPIILCLLVVSTFFASHVLVVTPFQFCNLV